MAVGSCSAQARAAFEAERFILPLDEWPMVEPAAVHCGDHARDLITEQLVDVGICAVIDEERAPVVHGQRLGNGAFGARGAGEAPHGHESLSS